VAINLFDDDMEIIQNFNDFAVDIKIKINGRDKKTRKIILALSADKNEISMNRDGREYNLTVPPRALIVLN
jgi:hypothetical protein